MRFQFARYDFRKALITLLTSAVVTSSVFAHEHSGKFLEMSLESILNTEINSVSKYRQNVFDAPGSITIITRETIETFGWRTLLEALQSVRGFYVSDDLNYTYIGARGFRRPSDYNNRILLMVNGHRLNENFFGASFFDNDLGIDLDWVERIEIVRGPSSSIYGSGAMFATVNIILIKGKHFEGTKISAEGSSNSLFQGAMMTTRSETTEMNWFAAIRIGDYSGRDLYFKEYDTPEQNYGIASKRDYENFNSALVGMNLGDWAFQGMFSEREKGIPTASWQTDFNHSNSNSKDSRSFLEIAHYNQINQSINQNVRVFADNYFYSGNYPFSDTLDNDMASNSMLGAEIQFTNDTYKNHRILTSIEYNYNSKVKYELKRDNQTIVEFNKPFSSFALVLSNEYALRKNILLFGSVRFDKNEEAKSLFVSPRFATIWQPKKETAFKLLYGDAYRAPNAYEQYYSEVDFAKASPRLREERIQTYEFVWDERLMTNLFSSFSLFTYKIYDLISQEFDTSDSLLQFINCNNVDSWGFEYELDGKIIDGTWFTTSYAYQRTNLGDSQLDAYNSPRHIAKLRLSKQLLKSVKVAWETQYESRRKTLQNKWTKETFLHNTAVTYDTHWNNLSVMFKVRNLFDQEYYHPAGYEHYQDVLPQSEREYRLYLRVTIK